MFTQDELKSIIMLINRSNITGQEATPVAILLHKISELISKENNTESAEAKTKEEVKK